MELGISKNVKWGVFSLKLRVDQLNHVSVNAFSTNSSVGGWLIEMRKFAEDPVKCYVSADHTLFD